MTEGGKHGEGEGEGECRVTEGDKKFSKRKKNRIQTKDQESELNYTS